MNWKQFFSLKWRWLLLILIINFIFFYMQSAVIYECARGECNPRYIDYWGIFPLAFFIIYAIVKGLMQSFKMKRTGL